MKYHIKRMTPEFRAIAYSLLVLQIGLFLSLFLQYMSVTEFFFGYAVLFVAGLAVDKQRTEIIDESKINLS